MLPTYEVQLGETVPTLADSTRIIVRSIPVDIKTKYLIGERTEENAGDFLDVGEVREVVTNSIDQFEQLKEYVSSLNLHSTCIVSHNPIDSFRVGVYDQTRVNAQTFGENDDPLFWKESPFNRLFTALAVDTPLPDDSHSFPDVINNVRSDVGGLMPFVGGPNLELALTRAIEIYAFNQYIQDLPIPDECIYVPR